MKKKIGQVKDGGLHNHNTPKERKSKYMDYE